MRSWIAFSADYKEHSKHRPPKFARLGVQSAQGRPKVTIGKARYRAVRPTGTIRTLVKTSIERKRVKNSDAYTGPAPDQIRHPNTFAFFLVFVLYVYTLRDNSYSSPKVEQANIGKAVARQPTPAAVPK